MEPAPEKSSGRRSVRLGILGIAGMVLLQLLVAIMPADVFAADTAVKYNVAWTQDTG